EDGIRDFHVTGVQTWLFRSRLPVGTSWAKKRGYLSTGSWAGRASKRGWNIPPTVSFAHRTGTAKMRSRRIIWPSTAWDLYANTEIGRASCREGVCVAEGGAT